jgi:hypothetical protein
MGRPNCAPVRSGPPDSGSRMSVRYNAEAVRVNGGRGIKEDRTAVVRPRRRRAPARSEPYRRPWGSRERSYRGPAGSARRANDRGDDGESREGRGGS